MIVGHVTGWDATAVLAGIAAATGVITAIGGFIIQRRSHTWEEAQEVSRRSWEKDQEQTRRAFEQAWALDTRWDALKRERYAALVSLAQTYSSVEDGLASIRRDLAEDLANRMAMIEHYVEEDRPDMIEGKSESELAEFWEAEYKREREFIEKQQKSLLARQAELSTEIDQIRAELTIVAPEPIRDAMETYLAQALRPIGWGRRHTGDSELEAARQSLIEQARIDLGV